MFWLELWNIFHFDYTNTSLTLWVSQTYSKSNVVSHTSQGWILTHFHHFHLTLIRSGKQRKQRRATAAENIPAVCNGSGAAVGKQQRSQQGWEVGGGVLILLRAELLCSHSSHCALKSRGETPPSDFMKRKSHSVKFYNIWDPSSPRTSCDGAWLATLLKIGWKLRPMECGYFGKVISFLQVKNL